MKLTLSEARSCLGSLCTRAQDPREVIVLTRHNEPVAALVSMTEVARIWNLQDIDERGPKNPLSGKTGPCLLPGFVPGLNNTPVTPREAALQMREVQMSRAAEREILEAGGLEPVKGGEVTTRHQPRHRWWRFSRA